jgi:transposase-like protein
MAAGPGLALVDLSVDEQRYRAVLEVRAGVSVSEVAVRCGMLRQSVHPWLRRCDREGPSGLADRSKRPGSFPHQLPGEAEGLVCELRCECKMPHVRRAFVEDGSDGTRTRDLRRDRPAL